MSVFVICNSHRAREKLERLIGFAPTSYYHRALQKDYQLSEIPAEFLAEALQITGVRKGKYSKDDWGKCWNSEPSFDPIDKGA